MPTWKRLKEAAQAGEAAKKAEEAAAGKTNGQVANGEAQREKEAERKRQEEESRRKQEEEAEKSRQEEASRSRAREEEFERKRKEEAEAEKKRQEEAERAQKEQEEAERKRQEAEEAERKRQEEEAERVQKERDEAERKEAERKEAERQEAERQEVERQRQEAEEAERKRQEEAARTRKEQEEEAERRRQEEAERARREQEEAAKRKSEEEEAERARREQEEAERKRRVEEEEEAERARRAQEEADAEARRRPAPVQPPESKPVPDAEPPSPGSLPLVLAVKKGDLQKVSQLLKDGVDPNVEDAMGETPIFKAAERHFSDIVAVLLMHGADTAWENKAFSNPLDYADVETENLMRLYMGEDVGEEDKAVSLGMLSPAVREAFVQALRRREASPGEAEEDGEAERRRQEAEEEAEREREAERKLQEEEERRKQEEAAEKRRQEEEAEERRRQEEEAERARAREEEAERKRQEEEAERARREQEEKEREEAERKRQEEAERARREQEEAERARLEQELAERKRQEEEEEAERLRREQEEAERLRREQEEAERARREQEEAERARQEQEEAERARREQEEAERKRQEEAERVQREQEAERARQEEAARSAKEDAQKSAEREARSRIALEEAQMKAQVEQDIRAEKESLQTVGHEAPETSTSASIDERLAQAVRGCSLPRARQILAQGADANARDAEGETPLFRAAELGNVDLVAELLLGGADPGIESRRHLTACDYAGTSAVETLLGIFQGVRPPDLATWALLQALSSSAAREAVLEHLKHGPPVQEGEDPEWEQASQVIDAVAEQMSALMSAVRRATGKRKQALLLRARKLESSPDYMAAVAYVEKAFVAPGREASDGAGCAAAGTASRAPEAEKPGGAGGKAEHLLEGEIETKGLHDAECKARREAERGRREGECEAEREAVPSKDGADVPSPLSSPSETHADIADSIWDWADDGTNVTATLRLLPDGEVARFDCSRSSTWFDSSSSSTWRLDAADTSRLLLTANGSSYVLRLQAGAAQRALLEEPAREPSPAMDRWPEADFELLVRHAVDEGARTSLILPFDATFADAKRALAAQTGSEDIMRSGRLVRPKGQAGLYVSCKEASHVGQVRQVFLLGADLRPKGPPSV